MCVCGRVCVCACVRVCACARVCVCAYTVFPGKFLTHGYFECLPLISTLTC